MEEIADLCGVSPGTIKNRLKEFDIEIRRTSQQRHPVSDEELIEAYEAEATLAEIAEGRDFTTGLVYGRLKSAGVDIRSRGEAHRLRKKPDFGDKDALGYVIGTLFGDGFVYDDNICLRVTDQEFAYAFHERLDRLGLDPPDPYWVYPPSYQGNQSGTYDVKVKAALFYEWYVAQTETELIDHVKETEEAQVGCVRGFFDSEGTFYTNPENSVYDAKMVNTNLRLIKRFKEILCNLGFETSIYTNPPQDPSHSTRYPLYIRGGKTRVRDFLRLIEPSIPRKQWES